MLYDFLLVSQENEDAERIKNELERNKLYKVHTVDRAELALEKIKNSHIHCVVFNVDKFTMDKINLAAHFHELGYSFPVIIFARYVQKDALEAVNKLKKTVLIEKPFESKDVWGIADKLVQGKGVPQRIHRRFYTNQKTVVQKTYGGDNFLGKMFNLSRGGAYVEVENGQFENGDILRLTIPLDKVAKSYVLDAEVVWSTGRGFWQGRPAIGIKFLKADDIYRNLLDKL